MPGFVQIMEKSGVMEFKVEIFPVWKIMENDLRYAKVMESVTADLEN